MNKKKAAQENKKPFTAANLIEYLRQFPPEAVLNMTHVTRRGKEIWGYPVEHFTLIVDCDEPHILIELGKAVPVERPAQRIMRERKEAAAKKKNAGQKKS